jgi:hypothetical protein
VKSVYFILVFWVLPCVTSTVGMMAS